jgi:hypothetical protein
MDKFMMIQQRAYQIWAERGQPEGQEAEHWKEAQRDVEASSPPEPDANGPTGAETPTGAEVPGGASSVRQGEQSQGDQAPVQPRGDALKEATELG